MKETIAKISTTKADLANLISETGSWNGFHLHSYYVNGIKQYFTCLNAIYVPSFVNYLFLTIVHFLLCCWSFTLIDRDPL